MRFDILTLFPRIFDSYLKESLLGKAVERGILTVNIVDVRDFATGRNRMTDDYPYGGGPGMVMKVEPVVRCLEYLKPGPVSRTILLTPSGCPFDQGKARELSLYERLIIICGRYEGVDARVSLFVDEEISTGDYILSGGEAAAMVLVDAISRLVPHVVGNRESLEKETFETPLLEAPQFTRPAEFRGLKVPSVLLSGDHRAVEEWRRGESIRLTRERRPDLYERFMKGSDKKD